MGSYAEKRVSGDRPGPFCGGTRIDDIWYPSSVSDIAAMAAIGLGLPAEAWVDATKYG